MNLETGVDENPPYQKSASASLSGDIYLEPDYGRKDMKVEMKSSES